MGHVTTRGRILYLSDADGEWGREWFHRTDHEDGTHTVRTVSEIDPLRLLRDVTHTVQADFRPLDCLYRLRVADDVGSGWFRFGERQIEFEGVVAGMGRISQRIEVEERPPYFGPHPVCGDAWVMACHDLGAPGRKVVHGYLSSKLVTGSDGPWLAPYTIDVEDVGRERITVPAGTFDTRRLRIFYDGDNQQDTWVTDDFQFVRLRNEEIAVECVLVELER